jgi:septal ring factor EnvC (AmiA/AmiB activator)
MARKSHRWLAKLTALVLVASAAAVAANAVRICFLTKGSFSETRAARIMELTAQRNQLDNELSAVRARLAAIPARIAVEEEKIRQADKVIAQLKDLESTWDRLIGNPAQQKANAEQIARMQQLRTESTAKVSDLRDETKRTKWEQDGLDIDRAKVAAQLAATERRSWALNYYLGLGWQGVRLGVIWAVTLNAAIVALVVVRSRKA